DHGPFLAPGRSRPVLRGGPVHRRRLHRGGGGRGGSRDEPCARAGDRAPRSRRSPPDAPGPRLGRVPRLERTRRAAADARPARGERPGTDHRRPQRPGDARDRAHRAAARAAARPAAL
ncbi:MAG: hypothetical protein AVDCRST_MAG30-212, partial [uncultured Solirubrobacteraceae bacterium]